MQADQSLELTILMPCLDEAETLATCVDKARRFLDRSGISGEVLVADNGSTDGSRRIAADHGARVVDVPRRGYGAALLGGIREARGKFVVMGDADDSYDFARLEPFIAELRQGHDLVMGNRFRGGIERGAMPFLHRYLGNPVLSFLGRLFFGVRVGDFHCGLRGFNRTRILALDLSTPGMEFASEMIVKAALAGYRISEVPTTLKPDGRSRPPHLRTWRDGWRHLRFLLVHTPRWLFLYPGVFFLVTGAAGTLALGAGRLSLGGVVMDIHSFLAFCMALLLGVQLVSFALISRRYSVANGFMPPSERYRGILDAVTPEKLLLGAALLLVVAAWGLGYCIATWARTGFGDLPYGSLARILMLSLTVACIGVQLAFSAFLSAIMAVGTMR